MRLSRLPRRPLWVASFAVSLLSACAFLPTVAPTEPPFCASFGDLGSVQLDYDVRPLATPAVSAAAAEAVARNMFGQDAGTTCSVRLAKYDNISDHRALVWVVHLDGLALPGAGGALPFDGRTPAPPPVLRRALTLVTVDQPPTTILSIAFGR
jgi:hypothetical protein